METANTRKLIDDYTDRLMNGSSSKSSKDLPSKTLDESTCLSVKPVNQWMEEASARPVPQMLFSEFWFEGEMCILFGDTGIGKSILAVQIADAISSGNRITGFHLGASPQTTLYLDFELSDKQFEARYTHNYESPYRFSPNFLRSEIDVNDDMPKGIESFEDFITHSIEQAVKKYNCKVLIVDNVTYLSSETERAKHALPLMKKLKEIKKNYGLSVLVLAHTPKRDASRPIGPNDLQGSKMLINFCDSSFCIAVSSRNPAMRYLKQIKSRSAEEKYGSGNVVECLVGKPINFLQFEFQGFASEHEHLKQLTDEEKNAQKEQVIELHKSGMIPSQIAKQLGMFRMQVKRELEKYEASQATKTET